MQEVFTTSLIVQVQPRIFAEVQGALEALPFTEIGHTDVASGKCIVLLETHTLQQIENWIHRARLIDGVLGVTMVYQQSDSSTSLNEVIA